MGQEGRVSLAGRPGRRGEMFSCLPGKAQLVFVCCLLCCAEPSTAPPAGGTSIVHVPGRRWGWGSTTGGFQPHPCPCQRGCAGGMLCDLPAAACSKLQAGARQRRGHGDIECHWGSATGVCTKAAGLGLSGRLAGLRRT